MWFVEKVLRDRQQKERFVGLRQPNVPVDEGTHAKGVQEAHECDA